MTYIVTLVAFVVATWIQFHFNLLMPKPLTYIKESRNFRGCRTADRIKPSEYIIIIRLFSLRIVLIGV